MNSPVSIPIALLQLQEYVATLPRAHAIARHYFPISFDCALLHPATFNEWPRALESVYEATEKYFTHHDSSHSGGAGLN